MDATLRFFAERGWADNAEFKFVGVEIARCATVGAVFERADHEL